MDTTGSRRIAGILKENHAEEFKILRRAVEDDKSIRLTTDLRTTQDKMYRQLLTDQDANTDLVEGFPTKVQELFQYEALILGSVDQAYLKPEQRDAGFMSLSTWPRGRFAAAGRQRLFWRMAAIRRAG